MPKSLRSNAKVPPSYKEHVTSKCKGVKLDKNQRLRVRMVFHAHWLTAAAKPRRRDHLNYAAVLCDVLCEALGIDDSRIWHLELLKKDSPYEQVIVSVHLTSAPA